jgi:hypothetical protein
VQEFGDEWAVSEADMEAARKAPLPIWPEMDDDPM